MSAPVSSANTSPVRRHVGSRVLLALALACTALGAMADPGDLDATFNNGRARIDFGASLPTSASAVAVQSDSKVVVAGSQGTSSTTNSVVVARLNSNGTLDTTFSGDGVATVSVLGQSRANALLLSGTKPVVAGRAGTALLGGNSDFLVARFNADGSLDTTFGAGGTTTTDFLGGNTDEARAIAATADGGYVLAGSTTAGGTQDFALIKYTSTGAVANFGSLGRRMTDFGGTDDRINALLVQSDGKIVAAGRSGSECALARYTAQGNLDTTFGTGGLVKIAGLCQDFLGGNGGEWTAVATAASGRVVAFGWRDSCTGVFLSCKPILLAERFNADGTLDSTFADIYSNPQSGSQGRITGAARHFDGRYLVTGWSEVLSGKRAQFVRRLNVDGSMDESFGVYGEVTTNFSGLRFEGVAVASDGTGVNGPLRVVTVGTVSDPAAAGSASLGVVRYRGN